MNEAAQKLMIVFRTAPYGTIYSYEGLENVVMMAAYEQDLTVLFIDDGVLSLKKGMDSSAFGIKDFSPTFKALEPVYDVEKIFIDKASLESRGLSLDELIIQPELIDSDQVEKLMEEQRNFMMF
ncbi:MAG: sulfurtransferase complex subunit TusC [Thermoleophilia bacterium]|nr:sulfurtransferase complex subunit TusC [Thermoleophilia bacterium]